MPQPPKEKQCRDDDETKEPVEDGSWEADQRERGYYYDDAHGYETFVDENDEEQQQNPPIAEARA